LQGCIVTLFLALSGLASAQYGTLETDDLRLVYRRLLDKPIAPYAAQCFENSLRYYRSAFDYQPDEKITVILQDWYDFNNGSALVAPRNTIIVQVAPANPAYETLPSNERINHTMNHEVAHVVALERTSKGDRRFRRLFAGKVAATPEHPETILYGFLTQPRQAAPRWYHEGLASFLETWMAGGIGRAQSAYDEMVFRAMVADTSFFYDPLGLESEATKVEFQMGATSYLYGTRFLTYMAYVTAPESLVAWGKRSDGSSRYYASQFSKVFGMPLGSAWRQWVDWERTFQQANLDSLRRYPLTPYRDLSPKALGSVSRAYLDAASRTLYVGVTYPGVLGHIAAISLDTGAVQKVCDIKGPALHFVTSLARDPRTGMLFFTGDNNEWRDLYRVDPRTGDAKRLIRDARIGDLVFSAADSTLWGVRHFNAISTLVRMPPPYDRWHQVRSWPYGQDIYDLDISPDARWLTFSRAEISGRHSLQRLDLAALQQGETADEQLHDFVVSLPGNFVFSADGRFLFGSSYYTGVSNLWRYDFSDSTMVPVSNCETGLFRPLPLSGDSLLAFRYSGDGFVPTLVQAEPLTDMSPVTFLGALVGEKHPVVDRWNVGSPARIDLDSLGARDGDYHSFGSIGFESVVPVVEGYKDYGAVGLCMTLSDPAFRNRADATLSVTPTSDLAADERLHANVGFRHLGWEGRFKYNAADFYDLFGPTKTSRKGYSLGLQYDRMLIYDKPKTLDLHVALAGYADLERLPYAQNVFATASELLTARIELGYKNTRRSLGAVDDERGMSSRLWLGNNTVKKASFNGIMGAFDFGFPFLVHHSSLWLRSAAGYSPGDRADEFANFYFGGFGNNWVDHGSEKRYRDFESFPGVDLNEIAGTNYVKSMLEWNLPPLRFQRVGTPGFYATWVRTALFGAGLVTNLESDAARRTLVSLGGQIDLQLTLLCRLPLTVSAGYGVALEADRDSSGELMLSLKVL
jgi:hypothetical protein